MGGALGSQPVVLLSLGVLLTLGGLIEWITERSAYQTCTATNGFLGSLVPSTSCSGDATLSHVGFVLFLIGLAALLVGVIVRFAERTTS